MYTILIQNSKIFQFHNYRCGESHGAIAIFTLTGSSAVVTSQEIINHNDPVIENVEVLQIISSSSLHPTAVSSGATTSTLDPKSSPKKQTPNRKLVWSFVYPGYYVYQWDADKRVIKNRIDCSKLVPCSESLKTIAIDEHFSPGRCQIASMVVQDDKLYIGTSWGCLIVAEAIAMRPITVFRPFSEEIQAIIAIKEPKITEPVTTPKKKRGTTSPVDDAASIVEGNSLIVTVGKGYRSLIGRYVNMDKRNPSINSETESYKAVNKLVEDREYEDSYSNASTMYALLWKPDDWLCE